jgi:hypothetical protein
MLKNKPVGEIGEIYDIKELKDEIIRRDNNLDIYNPDELECVFTA